MKQESSQISAFQKMCELYIFALFKAADLGTISYVAIANYYNYG